jgi:hypothetical protein
MTRTFFTALLLFSFSICYGQSFEGTLTYKVEFDIKTQKVGNFEISKEQVIQKMKSDGEYFDEVVLTIKEGSYEKRDNSDAQKRIVYKPDVNKIYTIQKNFEYVVITDASKTNLMKLDLPKPTFKNIDSTKLVNGHECSLLKLTWDKTGNELYFYNSAFLKINSSLFQNHNYEYLNEVLNVTNSYPMEIVKTVSDFITIRMTLVNVSEKEIEDSQFNLPEMTTAEKDYEEMMLKMTGAEVKKIKN